MWSSGIAFVLASMVGMESPGASLIFDRPAHDLRDAADLAFDPVQLANAFDVVPE
jgi:hypothetical protein